MLILTRRPAETIRIGDDVTVTILGIKGNQVRIGIDAPRDVAVHRQEIYERIRAEAHRTSNGVPISTSPESSEERCVVAPLP